jgi:hypothetical protein
VPHRAGKPRPSLRGGAPMMHRPTTLDALAEMSWEQRPYP